RPPLEILDALGPGGGDGGVIHAHTSEISLRIRRDACSTPCTPISEFTSSSPRVRSRSPTSYTISEERSPAARRAETRLIFLQKRCSRGSGPSSGPSASRRVRYPSKR